MKRMLAAACLAAVSVLVFASSASAAQPYIEKAKAVPADYILQGGVDTDCAFDVHVVGQDNYVFQMFFDKAGNVTRTVFHDDFVGTESANGFTYKSTEHATITDYPDGTESWTGQPLKLQGPHGTVSMDAGKLVWLPTDTTMPSIIHGPHPYYTNQAAYCALFTP